MYLVIIEVSNEREPMIKKVNTRGEAAAFVLKLKEHLKSRTNAKLSAEVFHLGEPVETFS